MRMPLPVLLASLLVLGAPLRADDWPQFRGPHRDGHSAETGLLKQWPEGGPPLLWSATGLGKGYSHVAVAGGRVYTTGLVGKEGMLRAYDANGSLLWERSCGPEWAGDRAGARGTPTVHEGLLYVAGGTGWVACFDAVSGEKKWAFDMFQRYQASPVMWGWADQVLIDGNLAIFTPAGRKGTMVAVDRFTGAPVWASKDIGEKSAYCASLMVELPEPNSPGSTTLPQAAGSQPASAVSAGPVRRFVVALTGASVIAVDPAGGELIWRHPYRNSNGNHPITPVYHDGMLYVTSGYGKGAIGLKVAPDGRSVRQVWEQPRQDTCHGGVVLVDGHVYGSSHRNYAGWLCVEFASGRIAWQDKCVGSGGSVICADGMLYCYAENGTVGLVRPSPRGCEVVGTFQIQQGAGEHWAHPVVSGGRLYIRRGDALMCYDVRDPARRPVAND